MSEPWSYKIVCVWCGESWHECYTNEVDPCKASDGETLCSPECRDEYETELATMAVSEPPARINDPSKP